MLSHRHVTRDLGLSFQKSRNFEIKKTVGFPIAITRCKTVELVVIYSPHLILYIQMFIRGY